MNELSESSLKLLREQTLRFLKLDFLYVIALGAFVSTLNITRIEIFDLMGKFPLIIPALVILLAIDAYSDRAVLSSLILKLNKKDSNHKQHYLSVGVSIQYLIHFLFLFFIISMAALNIRDKHYIMNFLEPYSVIQEELNEYIGSHSRLPTNTELLNYSSEAKSAYENLKEESFKIEPFGAKDYLLTFSRRDLKIGTDDDLRVTSKVSIRQSIDSIRNEFSSDYKNKQSK